MHFFVPQWVRHGRNNTLNAIYSVDIQPNAGRLATAGQDHKVRLWALPVIAQHARPAAEGQSVAAAKPAPPPPLESRVNGAATLPSMADNSEKPPDGALLAVLEAHTGAVNCVRWAPTGDLLASGGDDHLVLVYERDVTSAPTAFAAAAGAVESWRVWRPFRGHSMDVAHVCWSPDGERMASASVDNLVIVWNVRSVAPLARLEGHSGFVKGVAWDPVGKFIASQSDDRSVRVWRTSDWKIEKVIDEPFATAVFEENAQAFFLRLDWSPCGSHLLTVNAHKQPAVHCAPMFARESGFVDQIEFVGHLEPVVCARFSPRLYRSKEKPDKTYTVLLLGSKDSGASCWQATGVLPFFRMAEMFDAEVLDLAWGSDGYTMVACSSDGQVMYIRFAPEELGDVVSREETNEILKKTWRQFGGTFANGSAPPEYPAQLRATNAAAEIKVIEPAAPMPVKSVTTDIIVAPVMTPTPSAPSAKVSERAPPADPRVLAAQNETRVGGKRRITPVAVTPVNGAAPAAAGIVEVEIQEQVPAKRSRVAMLPASSHAVGFGAGGAYEQRLMGSSAMTRPAGAKEVLHATPLSTQSVVGLSLMLLPGPNESVGRCRFISNETPPTLLEAKEETSAAGGYSVTCTKGGKTLWKDFHPKGGSIVALAGIDKKFVAAAAEDGVLFLYSAASGRRIAPPLVIDSAPHLMEAFCMRGDKNVGEVTVAPANGLPPSRNGAQERWFLLVVSRAALCSVFDVRTKKLVCARSAAPLLARAEGDASQAKVWRHIVLARVTLRGEPILSLNDRHTFAYSKEMCAWARVADNSAPNSEFARTLPGSSGLLRSLGQGGGALLGMGDITRAATESLAHLESLLEAAIVLGAASDYRYYLSCYAARVAAAVKDDVHQCEERLRELCDTLLGAEKPEEDPVVIGMSGRALLKETVLPVVTASRELQRVAEEYAESLAEIEKGACEKTQNGAGNAAAEPDRDAAEMSN